MAHTTHYLTLTLTLTLLLGAHAQATAVPNGQGCVLPVARALPYCNTSMSHKERVADLLSRLTLEDKAIHLWGSGGHKDNETFPGIPRLGLPAFDWGLEAQHGLRVGCVVDSSNKTRCPTTFPGPTGLGATFNDSLAHAIGRAMAIEARALNNQGGMVSGRLVLRTPVLNLQRDPRWGRNVESPSEDPIHAGRYGAAIVSGVQTLDDSNFLLGGVEIKHFAVYQVEDCGGGGVGPGIPAGLPQCARMKFDANITLAELEETYFPAFKETAAAGSTGWMCSYNAVSGVPACADPVLSSTMRSWNPDMYCGTDCSAADAVFNAHNYAKDLVIAYADVINSGTSLICNPHNHTALQVAVTSGLISTASLDAALEKSFGVLFRLGLFDPVEGQPWAKIDLSSFGTAAHHQVSLEAARQSTVLLLNRDSTLPLDPQKAVDIVVVGPQGNATGQLQGNYAGSVCEDGTEIWQNMSGGGGQDSWWPCVPTLFSALSSVAPAATVKYVAGCGQRCSGNPNGTASTPLTKEAKLSPSVCNPADLAGIAAAVETALSADVAVLAVGFDTGIGGEGHDRLDLALPLAQQRLALGVLNGVKALRAQNKPSPKTVLVMYANSAVSIDDILEVGALDALLFGHMPGGTGGTAVAEAIFGLHNDFGKLSATVYPHVFQNQSSFIDMSWRTYPGRSHRFYRGKPLFAYGQGLSFSEFTLEAGAAPTTISVAPGDATLRLPVVVKNLGPRLAGSQVVFVWFRPATPADRRAVASRLGQDPPIQTLASYARSQSLAVGAEERLYLDVRVKDLLLVTAGAGAGADAVVQRVLPAGDYELRLDFGPPGDGRRGSSILHRVQVEADILHSLAVHGI